ncbi:MAG: alpha-1,2-fucosyltransferase [Actinomycetes bacterium]
MTNEASSRKVIVEVKGGLGNQMFQYAAARTLALELGAELLIEKNLGFFLDRQYQRTFELSKLPVMFSESTFRDSYPFYVDRLLTFAARRFGERNIHWKSSSYIFERDFSYIDFAKADLSKKRYWMSGYFQDPRYFAAHKEKILAEFSPPAPIDQSYLELGKLSDNYTLIALGIRMFEESTSPGAHARGGENKSIEDHMFVLSKLLQTVSNPRVLVFTTKEFDFLHTLNLPSGTIFVNTDRGFHNTVDKLWLLSRCKHHVFNNSTFYWWGATLSQSNFKETEQQIYCADNFLNPNIAYPNWNTF